MLGEGDGHWSAVRPVLISVVQQRLAKLKELIPVTVEVGRAFTQKQLEAMVQGTLDEVSQRAGVPFCSLTAGRLAVLLSRCLDGPPLKPKSALTEKLIQWAFEDTLENLRLGGNGESPGFLDSDDEDLLRVGCLNGYWRPARGGEQMIIHYFSKKIRHTKVVTAFPDGCPRLAVGTKVWFTLRRGFVDNNGERRRRAVNVCPAAGSV